MSFISGFYEAKINGAVTLGGVTLNVGSKVDFFQSALNGLYVPDRTVLGGHLGLSVTVPVGHVDMKADVTATPGGVGIERQTSGWGLGDITTRLQLGWQEGDFAHTAYVQAVAPSGRYKVGFEPDIGLNRPGIEATDYKSGTDFHFEWAVGREICTGLVIGVVGYDYRQITGDSGSGAFLGPSRAASTLSAAGSPIRR